MSRSIDLGNVIFTDLNAYTYKCRWGGWGGLGYIYRHTLHTYTPIHACTLKQILLCSLKLIFFAWNFLLNQMIQGKYIFFYGGKDEKWRKQFTEKVTDLLKDPVKSKISIELCCVERDNRLESLLSSRTSKKTKTESEWVVLFKGSKLVDCGYGTTMMMVLEEFDNWKKFVPRTDFGNSFKKHHDHILQRGNCINLIKVGCFVLFIPFCICMKQKIKN